LLHHLRHARGVVERAGKFFQQVEKHLPLPRGKCRQHALLRPPRGLGEPRQHPLAGRRELEAPLPPVTGPDDAADKTGVRELPQHHAGGGAVEAQELGDGDLVDAGLMPKHQHDAVLPVGDAKLAGFLQEHRHGNLVRAADHEAGSSIQLIERVCG
jgi:hypothetical protein